VSKNLFLTALLSLSLSVPAVFAEDTAKVETTKAEPVQADAGKVETRDVAQFFDESFNNMKDELASAKTDGKKGVLIMFEMEECPFCHRMKTTILNRSDIQDYFKKNFRIISVDIKGDAELTDFKGETTTQKDFALKEFRVRATPVFQVIGLDGEPVKNARLTGATKDADEFMLFGKYVVDKKNEDMPFSKFKHDQTGTEKPDDAKG
jgi:thioredoxin-related protein